MKRQLAWFGVIGASALLTHFAVVSCWLVPAGFSPLLANILGFMLGFSLSYGGHRLKTFNARHLPHRQTLPRFFAVACLGFALNELLYFLILRHSQLSYRQALFVVLLVVAGLSFLLGRCWAFRAAAKA